MQLVYLCGPPGVGKLTVGQELARLTGFRLFHNHLVVDLVTSVFPHESDAYFRLLRHIRQEVLSEAAAADVDLVCTGVYRGTTDQDAAVRRMLEPVWVHGGQVCFVQLTRAREERLARVQDEARRPLHKLTEPKAVLELLRHFDLFAAMPFEPGLRLDTTGQAPSTVANQIVSHFGLPYRPGAAAC